MLVIVFTPNMITNKIIQLSNKVRKILESNEFVNTFKIRIKIITLKMMLNSLFRRLNRVAKKIFHKFQVQSVFTTVTV